MSDDELLFLGTCDLGAILRGRAVPAGALEQALLGGVGWVPANHALTPLGDLAQGSPFDATGDLRLLPDPATGTRVPGDEGAVALELLLCDIVELDGSPWDCCPRALLRRTLAALHDELGLHVRASFEHEFQLLRREPAAPAFSLEALRRAEPLATRLMRALAAAGLEPERIFAEYAAHQLEVPVAAAGAMQAADRAVLLREVVREIARREGVRASFVPLLDPTQAGNGVHVHIALLDGAGRPLLHDPARPGELSELGGSFAAGILARAAALSALTAASPISAARLRPHRWSAGAVCLAERNREALLRIPPLPALGGVPAAAQMRLEYRGADASANPYLALGAIVQAGLDGIRLALPAPALLPCDPALLAGAEAERYGVDGLPRSLDEALAALAADAELRSWLGPRLHDAYEAVKRSELAATAELDLAGSCGRYAAIY